MPAVHCCHVLWYMAMSIRLSREAFYREEMQKDRTILLVAMFFTLTAPIYAQKTVQTYTDPNGVFQFKYPSLLERCIDPDHRQGLRPSRSCEGFALCGDPENALTLVCFAYPSERFQDQPAFQGAAFSVAAVERVNKKKQCVAEPSGWPIDPRGNVKIATINGVQFTLFKTFSVAMGSYFDGNVYRTFYHKTCYQLSININSENVSTFNPPVKNLTEKDWDEVEMRLRQCLNSFRFLKQRIGNLNQSTGTPLFR